MATTLRIHPSIGVSRVGNSPEFILSPETSAGMPEPGSPISGGLPVRPGTEADPISDADLRDAAGALKPHAQRFRIFAYDTPPDGSYPYKGSVTEVTVGSTVDGKTVKSIAWMVHMANKKANNWIIPENPAAGQATNPEANFGVGGMAHYFGGATPNLRNGNFGKDADPVAGGGEGLPPDQADLSDPVRLSHLVIDAGPKVICSSQGPGIRAGFDAATPCRYLDASGQVQDVSYPVQFPDQVFARLYQPAGPGLGSMGGMETDAEGRLLVIGSPGYAAGWMQSANNPGGTVPEGTPDEPFPLDSDIDNNGWFDDAGDGPVQAALTFEDGSIRLIEVPAWCICADPAYAPQVRNVVNIWDEVYNAWLRAPELALDTAIYDPAKGSYAQSYVVPFTEGVWTMFRAAHLQMFTTDLNQKGIGVHQRLSNVTAADEPSKFLNIKSFIRDPNAGPGNDLQTGAPLMPLALGDTGASFLTVTETQYFFLEQWFAGTYDDAAESLTPGEKLDKVTLTNLLGGRFSPGIDLTFIVRDPYLYDQAWTDADTGPFRIGARKLDYAAAAPGTPFLTVGYTPNRTVRNPVEPGDLCKFMALPWHTDYNSCATHSPSPNPQKPVPNTTLFWSWPAQRPVSVYTYDDYVANGNAFFGEQHFSVRGTGTQVETGDTLEGSAATENVGRYQVRLDMLSNWFNIGVVMQGPAITGFQGGNDDLFLEVASLLTGPSDWSQPWPILTTDKVYPDTAKPADDS
ncbi:LodA/GoxA family CTQ-dependent oxidase [Mangrovicoccus ximenensis]|uniref:LodA/GoxA family CTQ-dependent oxidase n=1 Tax=Mangrovicoccus ximenensis TaxID=1911570 RepID=UPI000D34B907